MVQRISKILNYHHLHYDDTLFGDQKYITEELLRNYAENDEYELQEINDLWDSTDPEIRVWQNPIPLHSDSYGISAGNDDGKEIYTLSNDTKFHGSTEFKNFNTIDRNKTTAYINTAEGRAEIPTQTEETINRQTYNNGPWGGMKANEYWYISFNRTKTYTPNKYTDINSTSIPAVCRAQKFTAKESGYLKTITLNLKGDKDAEYPLIIEVYQWSDDSKLPIIDESKKIAKAEYKFTVTSSALTAITFDSPPYITKDSQYFFLVKSPLTSYEHAYGIGGWSSTCGEDTYPEGSCYLSENNGYSWTEHGKKESKLKYHNGQNPPIDFAFTIDIEKTINTHPTGTYTIYFKTLRMNPIRYVQITPRDNIPEGTNIDYWISQNGKDWKNINTGEVNFADDTEEGKIKLYNDPNSTYLYLKVDLSTTNTALTPSITRILLTADTIPAHTGYLKSECFTPRTGSMLNASIWSRCYHPYKITKKENVNVKIDIYRNQINRDRFKIINPIDIKNYKFTEDFIKQYYNTDKTNFTNDNGEYLLQTITETEARNIAEIKTEETSFEKIQAIFNLNKQLDLTKTEIESLTILYNNEINKIETTDDAINFIEEYPLIINQLRKFNIFLAGTNQIPLTKPAVKYLKTVNFTNTEGTIALLEDHDFKVDYDTAEDYNTTSEIKLYNLEYNNKTYDIEDYGNTILNFNGDYFNLEEGDLEIEYNPIYLKGLTMEAFYKYNSNGDEILDAQGNNVCDGFPLDIMIDTFIPYNKAKLENDLEFSLSVDPVCTLRKVLINEGSDNERELIEDIDFTVDYENKRIKLHNDVFTKDTDYLTVRYTPNLTDTSLGVAYRIYRSNDTDQAYILPNYWQYRV